MTLTASLTSHPNWLLKTVSDNHRRWIKENKDATLGDLLEYLNSVQDELTAYDEDVVLADIIDELVTAADYLDDFTPVEEPLDDDGEMATVEYRLANVEEDIEYVEELIDELGEEFLVSQLPQVKRN